MSWTWNNALNWTKIPEDFDYSITVNTDDKLANIECFPLFRLRRRQADFKLVLYELESYISANSSTKRIGTSASLFCAEFASPIQQMKATLRPNIC